MAGLRINNWGSVAALRSDPHLVFCACSMQNGPHVFKVDHTGFCVFSKLLKKTFLIGRGDVTFLHVAYTKPSQNVGKLTCLYGRFKSPFFLWANTDFEGGDNDNGYGDYIFLVKHGQPSHNFDLLVIFCACSMQNVPDGSVVFQMDFRTK
jgi:hypothetical protein